MIIPVIFSLAPVVEEVPFTWCFYKGIDMVKHHGWPLFAQRQYFEEKENQKKFGHYFDGIAKHYDMDDYSLSDDTKFIHVMFPEELIQEYISRFPSQTDAFVASLNSPWPEMTQFMVDKVRDLENTCAEKIEAFFCLCDAQFIRDAAEQLHTDILHYEWAPFRVPAYRNTAYLDLKGTICGGEMTDRYEAFRLVAKELPIFNRREILAFFLNDENLHYAYDEDPEPEYEAGLGFGYNVPWNFNHLTQMTSAEMYTKTARIIESEKILVRYHPSDPIHADLRRGVRDTGSLIEFLRKSRRVVCNTSGLAYEAMLYNRPVYELGQSQYKYFTNCDLKGLPDHIAGDDYLSFIAFGYCIPFELIKSISYLRWRLSRPSEQDIYLYHLNYYMNCLNIDDSVIHMQGQARLEAILQARQSDISTVSIQKKPYWDQTDEVSRLYATIVRYSHQLERMEQKILQQDEMIKRQSDELNLIVHSKSWQLTEPLRAFAQWIRSKRHN